MADLLVIGAAALDRPIRLEGRLAPGARLQGRSLGGALGARLGGRGANAAVALAQAGHCAALCTVVADDPDGEMALHLVRQAGVDVSHVVWGAGASRKTLILIDPSGERAVLGLDAGPSPLPTLPPPSGAYRFDGLFVRSPYPGAEAWARASGGPVVAHWPAGGFQGPCDVLVTSAEDCEPAFLADPLTTARARFGARLGWAVITHGARALVAHAADQVLRLEPPAAEVVDSTGAGDVFAAGLLDALAAGADLESALRHACAWGATAVSLDSSAPVDGRFAPFRRAAP